MLNIKLPEIRFYKLKIIFFEHTASDIMYDTVVSENCVDDEVITIAESTQKRQLSRKSSQLKYAHSPTYEQQHRDPNNHMDEQHGSNEHDSFEYKTSNRKFKNN